METAKQTILVVDDESGMRNVIREVLESAGYAALLAKDGNEGLALARQHLPDLILCDIQMPGMNGYELLNAVGARTELRKVPFVFMTGVNTGQFDLRRGMALGADDYLTKPFTEEDLLAAIQTRLRKKQAWEKFFRNGIESTRVGFVVLLSTELDLLVMDILDNAQSLASDPTARPAVSAAAQRILRSGRRLSRLHENILLYAMLQVWVNDAEKITSFRRESVDSYLTVLRAIIADNPRIPEDPTAVTIEGADCALRIAAPDFGKIIDEVVDNAFKYSDPGRPVHLSAHQAAGTLRITVRDEGHGMSAEAIASVESLVASAGTPVRRQMAGLGLTIAKTLAELYGGGLTIQSSIGTGTTVTIALPVVA